MDLAVRARANALAAERDRAMEQAWTTAMLGRAKKPPALRDLLTPRPDAKARQRDWQDILKSVEAYVASVG